MKILLKIHFFDLSNLPIELIILRVIVCVNRSEYVIQSATTEMNIENSHIAKYGSADNVPFCW